MNNNYLIVGKYNKNAYTKIQIFILIIYDIKHLIVNYLFRFKVLYQYQYVNIYIIFNFVFILTLKILPFIFNLFATIIIMNK